MKKSGLPFISAISFVFALSFAHIGYQRAQLPYNELGRYYDGLVVWDEGAVGVYVVMALFFLLLSLLLLFVYLKKK